MGTSTRRVWSIPTLHASSTTLFYCIFVASICVASDLNCYVDVPTVEFKREVLAAEHFYGCNVIAYFSKWQDKSGRHYLPSDVQKILLSHVTGIFFWLKGYFDAINYIFFLKSETFRTQIFPARARGALDRPILASPTAKTQK